MFFELGAGPGAVRGDLRDALQREWDRMSRPGAVWSGSERIAIAETARAAQAGAAVVGTGAAHDAAATIATRPSSIRRVTVDTWMMEGLGMAHYVELVGVVSRLVAVDTVLATLGETLEPLPEPVEGEPTGEVAMDARERKAWVPMVGATSIVGALSMVPVEMEAMLDLHGPAYLTPEQMGDPVFQRGLHRAQMELVASRTSAINECFY